MKLEPNKCDRCGTKKDVAWSMRFQQMLCGKCYAKAVEVPGGEAA